MKFSCLSVDRDYFDDLDHLYSVKLYFEFSASDVIFLVIIIMTVKAFVESLCLTDEIVNAK